MITYISLVALVVPDYDVGLDFYVGTLGFSLVSDEDQGNGKRWVTIVPAGGGTGLLLAKAVNDAQSASIGYQTGGRVGFFLLSDDFQADYNRMTSAGVFFEETPRSEPYGQVAVWQDPFGNRWDLLQPK